MQNSPRNGLFRKPLFTAVVSSTLALLPLSGSAALVSITSGPTSGTSGSVTENSNTFGFTNVTPYQVKVTGVGDYTATGDTSSITLTMSGLISAASTDSLSLHYDATFALTGSGSLNWSLTSSLYYGFFSGPSASGGPITSADSGNITGTKSTASPTTASNVPYTAVLTVNWTGASAGDKLTVTIPTNSIDIAVVPEPSSLLLLGLGCGFLVRRRR